MIIYEPILNYKIKENEYYDILEVKYNEFELKAFISIYNKKTLEEKIIKIVFTNVFSTRISDESKMIKYQNRTDVSYKTPIKNNLIFKSNNSDYLEWFKNETDDIYSDDFDFEHFQIFALNEILDVISNTQPIIEILDNYTKEQENQFYLMKKELAELRDFKQKYERSFQF